MKEVSKICLITQARLESQRIPKKMILPFAGTTLFDIVLQKLVSSTVISSSDVFVSVYDDSLKKIVEKYPINVFSRSKKSVFSEGANVREIFDWWESFIKQGYEYIIMVNACCPFLKIETIDDFINSFIQSQYDSMFGVIQKKNYFWDKDRTFITNWSAKGLNTKTVDYVFEAAHCLYAGKLSDIGEGIWMGDFSKNNPVLYPVSNEAEVFDIDYPWQFEWAEILYKGFKNETV